MNFGTETNRPLEADVLVLGSGAAGCGAALAAAEKGVRVIMVDKGKLESSGCLGGGNDHFQAVLGTTEPNDTSEDFVNSYWSPTLGVDKKIVEAWANIMPSLVKKLEKAGVCFIKNLDGSYLRTGGFGDPGKWYINISKGYKCKPLLARLIRAAGIEVVDHVMITALFKENERMAGAIGYNVRTGEVCVFRARTIVLAMGNFANRLVPTSSGNPYNTWHNPFNTGSQFILAYHAGCRLLNLDLRQNVTLVPKGFGCAGMNGITEAGAHELNAANERFMPRYHPGGELSPRHFQIRGTKIQQTEGSGPPFFMDLRHVPKDKLDHLCNVLMPGDKATWLDYLKQKGLNLSREPMEIEFSEIEFGGIVETGDDLSTKVPGLYNACVFYGFSGAFCGGWLAGKNAACDAMQNSLPAWPDEKMIKEWRREIFRPLRIKNGIPQSHFENAIRQTMTYYMGLVRNERGMETAMQKLAFIADQRPNVQADNPHQLMRAHESFMLLDIARLATVASIERRETGRTTWMRSDYPSLDNSLNCVLAVENIAGETRVSRA